MVFRCWRMDWTCTGEVYTWTEDRQAWPRRRTTAGGYIHGLGTASRKGFARMVIRDSGTCWTCLRMFSLLSQCVRSFRPTSRSQVRDQVFFGCLRDILVRSGSCHLVGHLYMVGCCASSCTHIKPFGRKNESVSGWTRVVSHVHVSGHLCMVAEPRCVPRRWLGLESCHEGYVGRTTEQLERSLQQAGNALQAANCRIATLETAAGAPTPLATTTPSASMVDLRVLGKPSHFAGDDEAPWKSWSFVMLSFSAAVSPELRALMEKARTTADDMRNVNLTPSEQVWSRELYYMLSLSTSGEAQRRLPNVSEGGSRNTTTEDSHEVRRHAQADSLV